MDSQTKATTTRKKLHQLAVAVSFPSFLPPLAYSCIHSFVCLFLLFFDVGVKSVYQGNYNVDNLCALCQNECVNAASGGYSNYDGAFRCLEADAGDVAFIKHTTVADNAGNSSIYEYLCLNDTTSSTYYIIIALYYAHVQQLSL